MKIDMGKRKSGKQGSSLAVLLLILSLAGAGCGDGRQTGDPAHTSQGGGTEAVSKTGSMSSGYFFTEDGIVAAGKERLLYSDWEPVEFDYICMDPTCSHLDGSCSARTVRDEKSILRDFSLVYQNRLIILHGYWTLEVNRMSETVQEWDSIYQTDVYEADPDGSNRRKVAAFQGSIASPSVTYAAVLANGKLLFGGPMRDRQRMEEGATGLWLDSEEWISDAFYCLDLHDYTLETFAVTEDREVKERDAYQYQLYEYDGMIYGIISNFSGDSAIWYRMDPGAGVCEEIMRFDSNVARFMGAIGDTVYYHYENSGQTLYARKLAAGAEEQEVMTAPGEELPAVPFVVDGQALCMTDYRFEGEDRMAEYTVFDPEGKVLDTIHYDEYITFLEVLGDKILYYRMDADFDWEIWWVDKEDLKDLLKKGVKIGPINGARLDTLED